MRNASAERVRRAVAAICKDGPECSKVEWSVEIADEFSSAADILMVLASHPGAPVPLAG
jgi:hypothetical protein